LRADPERLVFIDGTSASTKIARLYGRAPKGERCLAAVPHGHWKTATFTAGLRIGGLAAPFVLDGPMDGDAFRDYVEQVLVGDLAHGDLEQNFQRSLKSPAGKIADECDIPINKQASLGRGTIT
jgi:hypothetical protein